MDQLTNYSAALSLLSLTFKSKSKSKSKRKIYKKCNECKRRRKTSDESHQICHVCYKLKTIYKPKQSGNKVIDDFVKYTQTNYVKDGGKMEFVPYDQFKDLEFIAEGGFSKIYKATWIDGPITIWENCYRPQQNFTVVLKKLNTSKNITPKELSELKIFYDIFKFKGDTRNISEYFGITQDPITQNIIIIMQYYDQGDLINYISNDFYNISWRTKLSKLYSIIRGLADIHGKNIIHRDFHSGNIFFDSYLVAIGDLGLSKSAIESTDGNNNETYGIIPYMAPEILQGQKYTTASDVYSFGMIMWEFMTGRRPFWDRTHDIELIIEICDGLRPPIVTNTPEGYIELMKECWHSDPEKRPMALDIYNRIHYNVWSYWSVNNANSTEIIKSSEIGPVMINNPGAIYKSRPLSSMIQSAMSSRSLRSQDPFYYYQNNNTGFIDKRKLDDNLIENNDDNGQSIKRRKLLENKNNDYFTKEIELGINTSSNQNKYITKEFEFDI